LQQSQAFGRAVVARVGGKPVCLEQCGRAQVLNWVPPPEWALRSATRPQDAFVMPVKLGQLTKSFQSIFIRRSFSID
jgi:hypothetical protein|tara:strand:- start:921 stop:1151 length:231 start_codon:yes stop_codon:yes gene_type:complete